MRHFRASQEPINDGYAAALNAYGASHRPAWIEEFLPRPLSFGRALRIVLGILVVIGVVLYPTVLGW